MELKEFFSNYDLVKFVNVRGSFLVFVFGFLVLDFRFLVRENLIDLVRFGVEGGVLYSIYLVIGRYWYVLINFFLFYYYVEFFLYWEVIFIIIILVFVMLLFFL